MSDPMYFIGVDLVTEKTKISRVLPIEYGQSVFNTSLNFNKDEIYNDEGNYLFPRLNILNLDKRVVLHEHAKQIFQSIIKNDPNLI